MSPSMDRNISFHRLRWRDAAIQRMRQRGCQEVGLGRPSFGSLRDRIFSSLLRTQRRELERLAP